MTEFVFTRATVREFHSSIVVGKKDNYLSLLSEFQAQKPG